MLLAFSAFHVLNAFRHQRFFHFRRSRPQYKQIKRAQRLSASKVLSLGAKKNDTRAWKSAQRLSASKVLSHSGVVSVLLQI